MTTKTSALELPPEERNSGGGKLARALADKGLVTEPQARTIPLEPGKVTFGTTLLWRVLVEPYIPKYKGMIETPPEVETAERILATQGRILQLGHFAFQSKTSAGLCLADEPNKPQVGDYVLYEQYAGQEVHLRSGHVLRLLNDTEILMVIKDPEAIKGYL